MSEESNGTWMWKTIALVVVAAVGTALLVTVLQQLVWDRSNVGLTGGAATGVAVAVAVGRRRKRDVPTV